MVEAVSNLAHELRAKDVLWPLLPIILTDLKTGEILYVAERAASKFGYNDPVEMLSQNITSVLSESLDDAADSALRPYHRVTARRRDGSTFPVKVKIVPMESLGRSVGIALVIDLTGIDTGEV